MMRILIFLFIFFALIEGTHLPAAAQQPGQWSPHQRIPGYADETRPPYLLADKNRTVHAFTSQWVGGDNNAQLAIIYNQWTLEEGWTTPIDILLSPLRQARIQGVYLDQAGMIHLIFFGGDDQGANIYYSRAPITNAGQASAWLTPKSVGERAITPDSAALAGDGQGNLVVIYSGNIEGNGVFTVSSSDGGETWSDPEPIFLTYDWELQAFDLELLGESGQMHAVWSVFDTRGVGLLVGYAKLDIAQKQWSDPIELATQDQEAELKLGVSVPNLIRYNGGLIATFYNSNVNGHWIRVSHNDGQTWTEPVRISPRHIGTNGAVSMVIDNDNILHLLFGNRIPGQPDIHGMWHTTWQSSRFTDVEAIVSGPLVRQRFVGDDKAFDPTAARAIISQGNILLVTWQTDWGNGKNGVWYSYTTLDVPELPIIPLPTPFTTPISPADHTADTTPTPTPTRRVLAEYQSDSDDFVAVGNPSTPLISSVILVMLLLSAIIGTHQLYRHSRH